MINGSLAPVNFWHVHIKGNSKGNDAQRCAKYVYKATRTTTHNTTTTTIKNKHKKQQLVHYFENKVSNGSDSDRDPRPFRRSVNNRLANVCRFFVHLQVKYGSKLSFSSIVSRDNKSRAHKLIVQQKLEREFARTRNAVRTRAA